MADYVRALLTMGVWQDERIKNFPVPPGVCPKVNWWGYKKGPVPPKTGNSCTSERPAIGSSLSRKKGGATNDKSLWTPSGIQILLTHQITGTF